jgi:beta-galactosidase
VEVCSNCEGEELFLNGRSLGAKARNADDSARTWQVAYEAGMLRGVGNNRGVAVASRELRTTGKAARIRLTADRKNLSPTWDDVCYVEAAILDQDGTVVPGAGDLVTFTIAGPGQVAAVDSGSNSSHEPFQAMERHACQGRCVAVIKAGGSRGRITISASAPGLSGGSTTIDTIAPSRK